MPGVFDDQAVAQESIIVNNNNNNKRKSASKGERLPKKRQHEEEDEKESDTYSSENDSDMGIGVKAPMYSDSESTDEDEVEALRGFDSEEETSRKGLKPNEKEVKHRIAAVSRSSKKEKPGVLYVGRVPHGFYEDEMRSYFSQFGDITRLRLSRNKKTGKSKHYAFIEFKSADVAQIVAETMDNYLLFNHILKVKLIPSEQVHDNLFIGANKKYKTIPWRKLSQERNDRPKTEEQWEKLKKRDEGRRRQKQEKLKSLGIDYEIPGVSV